MTLTDRVQGIYRDADHNTRVAGFEPATGSDDACSSGAQAFGYPTTSGQKPGFIVVICQLAFDKSDMVEGTNLPVPVASWRIDGDLVKMSKSMNNRNPPEFGVDILEKYLSVKVLHEMMHVGDCIKCKSLTASSEWYH